MILIRMLIRILPGAPAKTRRLKIQADNFVPGIPPGPSARAECLGWMGGNRASATNLIDTGEMFGYRGHVCVESAFRPMTTVQLSLQLLPFLRTLLPPLLCFAPVLPITNMGKAHDLAGRWSHTEQTERMTTRKTKVADFATLAERFLELEQEEFGGPAQGDARKWRNRLLRAVGAGRLHRERLGLLLVDGRKHFKKDRVWLRVKKAVANAAGYRSRRSIETLLKDAERAKGLRLASADRYHALERCGVDPAQTRWANLIERLSTEIPENETAETARMKVEELFKEFTARKGSGEIPGGSNIERLRAKIERLAVQLFRQLPKDQHEAVIQKIVAEATKKAEDAAVRKAAADSKLPLHPANSQPVLFVPKNGKDGNATIGRRVPPGPTVLLQNAAHPWGDAFLGSLVPGAMDQAPLDYRERELHRASREKEPKRYYVGDIFAAGLSDFITIGHLEFFQKTDWHTYLVLSANIRRMLEICNRTDTRELPRNLWIGVPITSSSDFNQIESLGTLKTPNKWVSFLPFRSGRPIRDSSPTLEEILRGAGIRWVVFGGDQLYGWNITGDDEEQIVHASHAAQSPVYCTSIQTLEDLIHTGEVDSASVPGVFTNGTQARKTWKLREFPDFRCGARAFSAAKRTRRNLSSEASTARISARIPVKLETGRRPQSA